MVRHGALSFYPSLLYVGHVYIQAIALLVKDVKQLELPSRAILLFDFWTALPHVTVHLSTAPLYPLFHSLDRTIASFSLPHRVSLSVHMVGSTILTTETSWRGPSRRAFVASVRDCVGIASHQHICVSALFVLSSLQVYMS